jgi:UPF0755 protein
MGKPAKVFIGGLAFMCLAATALGTYVYLEFIKNPASADDNSVIYEVKTGQSFATIAQELQDRGIVKSAKFFNIFARLSGERAKIKVGEYEFKSTMRPTAVLSILTSGKSIFRKFTVSEGLSIYEIADLYEKQGFGTSVAFLSTVRDPQLILSLLGPPSPGEKIETLEGYLFPETYQITKYTTTKELVIAMTQMFFKQYEAILQAQSQKQIQNQNQDQDRNLDQDSANVNKWSRHRIVTMASLIEKETGASFEREKISSVFHNRLKRGMKLQTDPTIIYGKAQTTGKIEINITRSDLTEPTAYNTYVISGMPPGPIANPGRASLQAVFHPEKSNFLFFVSKNDGTQVFSESLDLHNKAVQKYQVDPKARENKSWRDLNGKAAR